MFVISTTGGISLVFYDIEEVKHVVTNLQSMIDAVGDTDDKNNTQVYTMSDHRVPMEEVKTLVYFIKERFSHNEGSEDTVQ